MNPIRQRAVDAIEAHAHHGEYLLAWNVKIHRRITDPNEANPVPGWDINQEYQWALEDMWRTVTEREDGKFYSDGRSSGWIVLAKFEGHTIDVDEIEKKESGITNEWYRRLLKMLPIWDEAFKDPTKELQYQIDSRHAELKAHHDFETAERRYWEERDVVTV